MKRGFNFFFINKSIKIRNNFFELSNSRNVATLLLLQEEIVYNNACDDFRCVQCFT